MHTLRPETPQDMPSLYRVNRLASGRDHEAMLVDRPGREHAITLSLVASQVVGHILITPVTIHAEDSHWEAVALGLMAFLPSHPMWAMTPSSLTCRSLYRAGSSPADKVSEEAPPIEEMQTRVGLEAEMPEV